MPRPRGKLAAIVALAATLATLGTALYLARWTLLEAWHLRRLDGAGRAARIDAARALARLGSVRAAARLFRLALEVGDSSELEGAAALALRTKGSLGAPAFAHEMRLEPWSFRVRVVERLATMEVPPEYASAIVGEALRDESPAIRRWGAESLTRRREGPGEHAPRLRELMSDPDEDVRLWAGISLSRLGPEPEGAR